MNRRLHEQDGSVMIVSLMLMVVLMIIGISINRTSSTELMISANQLSLKQGFYLAEGGLHREAQEVGRGNYPVTDIHTLQTLATESTMGLPTPTPHQVLGNSYNFSVDYIGFFLPPKGYSSTDFSRYDYDIDSHRVVAGVKARYYKIGPKAN